MPENAETEALTDKETGKPVGKPARLPFQKHRQLERDIEHITGEMYKRNKELAETNKTLSLLRTIDALVLESHATLKMVSDHITEAIVQVTDYPFVGLLTRSTHSRQELVLNGWSTAGKPEQKSVMTLGFSKPIHIKLTHPWFGQIEDSKLVSLDDLPEEAMADFLNCPVEDIKRAKRRINLRSLYVVKLLARRQIVGLLVVGYLTPTQQLSQSDTALLDRLSESVGVALDNKLLFEENQHVLRQIKESNAKLLALDEAKDDFISMASHQLRTPLTSVKGYISMIKEGDAGKITPMQSQMLNQAFFSSQRMVYLIADLLNVSRLRTGKFVIDTAKVDLAQMICEEVDQLKEIAKVHSQELIYKQPKNFPDLMLDDVKTRQVIMNFLDNALHYTPKGGTITVHLLNNPTTVEFRVEDNGIGVPASERAHLFTKFYRAANARKARPDGTGLGLFMAKKVIIAQGGSLIFESKESKGSIFGFIFSKAKHTVPPDSTEAPAKAPVSTPVEHPVKN
ncbi:MAG TPA: HAMP domain-containing sensor histidine kinase [Candidatus Dormibacteraeota bacterium]|nr:HAMP domain-containing sensor histidine kinase [Candidatus Dormibacteraeota bacterium]